MSGDQKDSLATVEQPIGEPVEGQSQEDSTPAAEQPKGETSNGKFDPTKLSPELQEQYKAMQADYTRKTQAIADERKSFDGLKQRAETFDQLLANEGFQKWLGQHQEQQTPKETQREENALAEMTDDQKIQYYASKIADEKVRPLQEWKIQQEADREIDGLIATYGKDAFKVAYPAMQALIKDRRYYSVPLNEIYKLVTWETRAEQAKEETLETMNKKKAAQTIRGGGSSNVVSESHSKTVFEAARLAKQQLGQK